MDDDDDPPPPPPTLACGHRWDGRETVEGMAVIQPSSIDTPEGPRPAVATAHLCRACRAKVTGERFASMEEAWAWLRRGIGM
jgi:hypothetical protein